MNTKLAMTSDLIINLRTSSQPLIFLRDLALRVLCWGLWGAVMIAVFNGCDWPGLGISLQQLLTARTSFFVTFLAALHVSQLYVFLTLMLIAGFMLWSLLHLMMAPWRQKRAHLAVWSTEAIAQHFHVELEVVNTMLKERQILVFHALSGAVTELRSLQGLPQQHLLRA